MNLRKGVLVVCADSECRQMLLDTLKDWDASPRVVSTITEARQALTSRSIELVFCEDRLADGRYSDLLDMTALSRTPARLVVLTHGDEEQAYAEAIQAGAFDAIPIPFSRSDVQWMIIHALSITGSRRDLTARRAEKRLAGGTEPAEEKPMSQQQRGAGHRA